MKPFVGRERELAILEALRKSNASELVAIYGRRRVGKTHLVRRAFENKGPYLEVIGKGGGKKEELLQSFFTSLRNLFSDLLAMPEPRDWAQAFEMLSSKLEKMPRNEKCIVFLDELPWLAAPKSGLVEELERFWNARWSRLDNLLLVVCGSAASWMLSRVIKAKGGLHNRITRTIALEPFDLKETRQLLEAGKVKLTHYQIIELYMAMGGVPFYLEQVTPGKSPAQIIDEVCFRKNGLLYDEFEQIFPALFGRSKSHEKLIRQIAKKRYGISRGDLIKATKIKSGAALNRPLEELEAAGFIAKFIPYGKNVREQYFKVIDEYTNFYLTWISGVRRKGLKAKRDYWLSLSQTPAWKSWAGYAFEGVCQKHADQILFALGISGIHSDIATWRYAPQTGNGAQVDLLFDRRDGIITLVEIKFTDGPATISKRYADSLRQRIAIFKDVTGTRKSVLLVMLSPFGTAPNTYARELLAADIKADVLFEA